MATLSVRNPTLLDMAKAQDPDGKIAVVVEILNEVNEILDDMVWVEGNLTTGHMTTQRTGLPAPTWRKMYGGVQPTKGTTAQVTDNTGMLVAFSEIDMALAKLNNNTAAYRLLQDRAHIEGMAQELSDTLFFGNEDTEPEAFTGFAPRYNTTSAESGDNIILGGSASGQTDNRSIWLVTWGDDLIHGIIPKGSTAGLQVEDLGMQLLQDASDGSNTGRMKALVSHYEWHAGLTVADWRYAARIPNIDNSLLTPDASSGADLADLMFQAMNLIPNLSRGRPAFYMSRDMLTFLRRQLSAATSMSTLQIENVGGKMVTSFQGIPIRRCDTLAADETRIT
ncbi:hypothetical protein LCGC14_0551920 [marine sediment metagenome]|uniref:Uncharacterized protein n=1 Tax=marine sediment metagenome TaxID=412755 RepID=A0A0F9RPM6_9ZZZZ